jgi:hypothetical protein
MATDDIEDLEPFVKTLDAPTLASVLLELAREHDAVRRRLARLKLADRPDRLAAAFRKTLAGWRRASKFLAYREAREFGLQLEGWLGQVEREFGGGAGLDERLGAPVCGIPVAQVLPGCRRGLERVLRVRRRLELPAGGLVQRLPREAVRHANGRGAGPDRWPPYSSLGSTHATHVSHHRPRGRRSARRRPRRASGQVGALAFIFAALRALG